VKYAITVLGALVAIAIAAVPSLAGMKGCALRWRTLDHRVGCDAFSSPGSGSDLPPKVPTQRWCGFRT
jgi:hypothetical protein